MKPLTVSFRKASKLSGLGRTTLFKHAAAGTLVRVKVGRRSLITVASLEKLLTSSE